MSGTAATWPFWAPSEAASVEAALDLAGVGAGVRFVDLGCGDGQVLVAAAARDAIVTGIESDEELVDEARRHLADAGVDGAGDAVRTGDLLDPDVDLGGDPAADVYFTYLAPATLQRLLPRLASRRGARLVTVDFDVPGLVPDRRSGSARLYTLPGRRRPVGRTGWPSEGTLVSTIAEHHSLSCLELVHPGGPTSVRLSRHLASVVTVLPGAEHLDGPAHLAVDLRWEPMAAGTVVGGAVRAAGVDWHGLFVVTVTPDGEEEGMWDLTAGAIDALRRALRRRRPPTTLAELLATAND